LPNRVDENREEWFVVAALVARVSEKPEGFTTNPDEQILNYSLVLCSNSFLGLLLAEGLVLFFAFEAHGMMIRSVNPNLQLEQSTI
jgi:hypothetical protein